MAIAIRMDATQTSLKRMVDRYTKEGRPAMRIACSEPSCHHEYLVYYGPAIGEPELREGFAPYLQRDHPHHPVLYEIDESAKEDATTQNSRPCLDGSHSALPEK